MQQMKTLHVPNANEWHAICSTTYFTPIQQRKCAKRVNAISINHSNPHRKRAKQPTLWHKTYPQETQLSHLWCLPVYKMFSWWDITLCRLIHTHAFSVNHHSSNRTNRSSQHNATKYIYVNMCALCFLLTIYYFSKVRTVNIWPLTSQFTSIRGRVVPKYCPSFWKFLCHVNKAASRYP
jgi:hypothetical protein